MKDADDELGERMVDHDILELLGSFDGQYGRNRSQRVVVVVEAKYRIWLMDSLLHSPSIYMVLQ